MKKIYATLALAFTSVFANASDELVQFQTWYGDNMGATSETTATKRIEYFYDNEHKLVRRIQTGLMENGTDWLLTNYYLLQYNESGQLTETSSLQYGIYDQNQYALKATNDTIDYRYNAQGLLAEEYNHAKKQKTDYSYDSEGRVVKTEIYKSGILSQTLTYSEFTKGGAQKGKSESNSSYNCYDIKMTYNEFGNKTSELHYDTDGTLIAAEYWTYDYEFLTLYEKKGISGGKEIDSQKTTYEAIDDNTTRAISYTYGNGEWKKKGGSTCETTKARIPDYPADLKSIEPNSETSSVKLTIDTEGYNMVDMYVQFRVYRDGLLITTLNNPDAETLTYTDTNVGNGDHEYFVQLVCNGEGCNISNILKTTLKREYPKVTNLRPTTARKTAEGNYYVTLAWDCPNVTDDMQFVNYNVMKVGTYYASPMLEEGTELTDSKANTVEVSFGIDAVQTIYVQTRYQGGVVSSDTITVDATKYAGKTDEANRTLHTVETWGDAMGNDMGITSKEITYYGTDNRPQRIAKYSKALGADANDPASWTIWEYTTNEYGESGMLEKQYTKQYGRYDHGGMGFRAPQDTTFYEYNLEGQKILEKNRLGYTEYTYDTDGSLVQEHTVEYAVPSNIEQTITYSDFAGKDKPCKTVSTGTRSSAQWMMETEYNANGKKELERKSSYKTSTQTYVPSQQQEFYYNNGELVSDTVFTIKIVNGIEQYSYKSYTTYEPEEGNPNRVTVVKKVWDSILKKFGNPKTWNVYEYTDINAEKYAPTVELEYLDGSLNTLQLKVSIPEEQRNSMTAFNIYRNGIEIAHALSYFDMNYYTTDEFGLNGEWTYVDKEVSNGTYDYFVEYAQLDNTMKDIAKRGNISNIVKAEFNTTLPAPSNLRQTGRRTTTTENTEEGTIETNIFVSLQWDEPADAAAFNLLRYEVMVVGSQVAENYQDTDQTVNTYELAMRGLDKMEVYVDAVYPIGRVSSNTITVEATETAIKALNEELKKAQMFNLNGQPVKRGTKGIVISNGVKTIRK